jgi:hypothetical protein
MSSAEYINKVEFSEGCIDPSMLTQGHGYIDAHKRARSINAHTRARSINAHSTIDFVLFLLRAAFDVFPL